MKSNKKKNRERLTKKEIALAPIKSVKKESIEVTPEDMMNISTM